MCRISNFEVYNSLNHFIFKDVNKNTQKDFIRFKIWHLRDISDIVVFVLNWTKVHAFAYEIESHKKNVTQP